MGENKNGSLKVTSIIRQALMVNKMPFPWLKAFCAGLAASLPIMFGLLLGNFQYGLLAGMGGFTYLYVFHIPYAQRAKKLFFVILGITFVTFLGTVTAPHPLAAAILMGLIGGIGIFIFGALKIKGPSAIFFVLIFAMTSGMPVQPELAPLRAGLAFLGGALSWVIAMIGWFFHPHGPEQDVVKREYFELASFFDSIGSDHLNAARQRVMTVFKEAEETLTAGYISWRKTDLFQRLFLLHNHANLIFMTVLENIPEEHAKLPPEMGDSIRNIAQSLDQGECGVKNEEQKNMDQSINTIWARIYEAEAILQTPITELGPEMELSKQPLKTTFLGAFDKNSFVFISALRFGVVTMIAAIIAYKFGFNRAYWIPLSCVAVMSGATIVSTYHRAIQRGIGTILGILIASLVLSTQPTGYMIAFFVLLLTFITELFIVKNYGLAALFFTPNALLMAESGSHGNYSFSFYASARILDVIIGIVIGILGVLLLGRQSASSRLPHNITKTIRSQAQFLFILFSDQGEGFDAGKSRERSKMRTNLNNLRTMYDTATGEIPVNQKALEYYWPVIFSIEQLGYLLEKCSLMSKRPVLSDDTLAQLFYVFETIANAADRETFPVIKNVPKIGEFPSIEKEIDSLQHAFQLNTKK
ncbi:FUSC family protein [Bacillus salipaludis]|uniref:FUSC family protein n=1 Tax=Bacillus salipaludis TaxID=2547811 RepID=A0A4R5VS73_9BACI|nr:FUSC family protein [Bacillus salipaludis]TDK60681.1 FUSC family protein [Bacillus salipaludis]